MKRYLTRQESADWLTEQGLLITKNQLERLATTGGGPPYAIVGNKALYEPDALLDWAEARLKRRSVT